MILESSNWKEPLLDTAKRFREYAFSKIDEEVYVKIEKDIFIGFYSIRKLIDTDTKVTDNLKIIMHDLYWYKHMGDEVNWRNNHKLNKLYDLDVLHKDSRDLWFISSRIVHSFIFNLCINEKGNFDGILFTSDNDKNKKLYQMNINQIIEIFELVGNNNVTELIWKKCPKTGNEITIVK